MDYIRAKYEVEAKPSQGEKWQKGKGGDWGELVKMGGDEGDGDGAPSPSHPLVREGLKMRMVKRQGGEIVSREEGRWERRKLWWEKRNKER